MKLVNHQILDRVRNRVGFLASKGSENYVSGRILKQLENSIRDPIWYVIGWEIEHNISSQMEEVVFK